MRDRFSVFIGMGNRDQGRKGGASEHDHGYKRLFSHPVLVEELLRGFLQEDWIERLDFPTLERVGNSFVSDDLRERHSDLIWRLRFKETEHDWFYLYLLLELQSTSYHFMAVRLLSYVGLLLEEIVRKEKLRPGDRIPAVLPLVLYNGKHPWRAPATWRTYSSRSLRHCGISSHA
jgi:predicted transposase YdaD